MIGKKQFGVFLVALTVLSDMFLVQSVYAHDNIKYGFSMDPPSGWIIQEQTEPIIVSFKDDSNSGVAINVVVGDSYGATLEQVVTASRDYLSTLPESYRPVTEGVRVVGRLNGYQL